MPLGIGSKSLHELVPLVTATTLVAAPGTGMRLVDDDELRARPQKLIAPSVSFDEVEGDDRKGIDLKDRLADPGVALQPCHRPRQDELCIDVELIEQFRLPLLGQVRRAEHRQPLDLRSVEQLPRQEASLDRLPDPNVIGDQDTDRIELQTHQ